MAGAALPPLTFENHMSLFSLKTQRNYAILKMLKAQIEVLLLPELQQRFDPILGRMP